MSMLPSYPSQDVVTLQQDSVAFVFLVLAVEETMEVQLLAKCLIPANVYYGSTISKYFKHYLLDLKLVWHVY